MILRCTFLTGAHAQCLYNKSYSFYVHFMCSSYDEDRDAKTLLGEYDIPEYFRDDLFKLVGEKRRPPYRWFLIGPARSGSCSIRFHLQSIFLVASPLFLTNILSFFLSFRITFAAFNLYLFLAILPIGRYHFAHRPSRHQRLEHACQWSQTVGHLPPAHLEKTR